MKDKITVALAGNPNSGKTTIFNAVTGAKQHVGNYPGVTVEKKTGVRKYKNIEISLIDLPGTYSLTAYSMEEIVSRNFIIDQHPDVVVAVIDASSLERNLYLAVQLIEMNVPLILAFNMSDVAKRKGLEFDLETLSELMGVKIVETIGNKSVGINDLLDAIIEVSQTHQKTSPDKIKYGKEIEDEIAKIMPLLESEDRLCEKYGKRWLASKLLENDKEILDEKHLPQILEQAERSVAHLKSIFGDEPEIVMADKRYGFISGACQEVVRNTIELRHSRSDMIDAVLIHKVFGLPIFILMMYVVFDLTFRLGGLPMSGLEFLFGWLGRTVSGFWPVGSESIIRSLLVDGIISGVGGVVIFLPNILLLFAAIAILEGTGYMARAAFVMDRLMHKIGLHGKSFIPMIIGFGCSVPAIMACRILENRRNRITTILVTPLFSCGAKLTIYALLIPAFFPEHLRGPAMWLIYFVGVVLAVVAAKVLRTTLLKGETVPYVMELPPYRVPTLRAILIHMWERGWMYLKKAGTVILVLSIILWAGAKFPMAHQSDIDGLSETAAQTVKLKHSVVGRIGSAIEPVIKPLGFDYKIGTALIGAMAAKEVFVAQMSIVYSVGQGEDLSVLQGKLSRDYSPLQGFCIMLFCLISAPCVATVAITRVESGSWKWALLQWFGLTALAYVLTLAVYQIGSLFV